MAADIVCSSQMQNSYALPYALQVNPDCLIGQLETLCELTQVLSFVFYGCLQRLIIHCGVH